MRKILISITAIMAILVLTSCSTNSSVDKKTLNVGILQIVPHGSLDAARKGFKEELNKEVKEHDKSLKINYNYQNAQGDQANLSSMSQQLVQKKDDLILGIATPAAQALAKKTNSTPIVVTAVTNLQSAGLVKDDKKPQTNVTGTKDLGPVDKQIKLLTTMTKSQKPIGVLYNSSEENSVLQVKMVKKYAKNHHLKLNIVSVTSTNDVASAVSGMAKKVSGIYLPTDNLMASSMKTIGKKAREAKLPVVTGSIEMAEDGGTATYGINYHDLGKQTAKMAYQILIEKKKPQDMPVETSHTLRLYINKTNAKAIGINPDKIMKP
ncbi:ABC transporter substrate-binding protein [Companilactobacillus alimentarius]|uniref:ABC transporter substrate-binding protein n=1 Tax=Companilactobacillus alimentarius DSM 20249 TaxID=1423720 RepID=A0A2K9HKM3_9LACO|nr:ABC transporter substrate-binding protein [Companilactobacillus alimentarius]AUI72446.1 ABC transporter substrate-binding protein [Companilactobacillus alimentarius DSM 20249]MDT6953037.1 ABC transporter substrate-binding protein [Companilactobacillus alimentarius]GEO44974.1 ABC transporter substrate-binding protein [Companilactobacillus alimentarius]